KPLYANLSPPPVADVATWKRLAQDGLIGHQRWVLTFSKLELQDTCVRRAASTNNVINCTQDNILRMHHRYAVKIF
ncbi:MAG: hypothetical protein VYD35_00670, partial [Actinomycetota bacterium]|nr:hypothetical protein [Actinomycetota bacterium]